MRIRISWKSGEAYGTLIDTPTSRAIYNASPFTSVAHTWGEEVYFSAPVEVSLESNAKQVVAPGTICFWVQGSSLALPYGPTPVSEGKECRLVTAVNVLGKLEGDPRVLASIQEGDRICVETADD